MNCKDTRKWLSPYLDSELGKTKTYEISTHLDACPECKDRFDAERHAEELIRSRLDREPMPPELWSRITRDVSTPSWIRRLRNSPVTAVAACVAFFVIAAVVFSWNSTLNDDLWIVRELAKAAPLKAGFEPRDAGITPDVEGVIWDTLGVRITLRKSNNSLKHTEMKLVSATRRSDEEGHAFVEVRLNCCGHPVLLILAAPDTALAPTRLASRQLGDIKVGIRTLGGVVAVAASPHEVDAVLEGLNLMDT